MTIAELSDIVSTGDKKHIKEQLKAQGYSYYSRRKYSEAVDLNKLFLGDLLETDLFADEPNNLSYKGGIYYNVQNHENCEIVIVCIGNLTDTYPMEVTTWAKII